MFETSGQLDENMFKFMEKHALPKDKKLIHKVGFYLFGVSSIICLVALDYLFFGLSFAMMIVVGLYNHHISYKNANVYRQFLGHEKSITLRTKFMSDGIHVLGGGREARVKYEVIESIEKYDDMMILYTKEMKTLFVFCNQLEDETKFIDFLKKQKTNIRWELYIA